MGRLLIILIGAALGAYLGLYIGLYGGIVDIITGVQSNPADAGRIAFGVIRILLASPVGWFTFVISAVIAKEI
jgi:hypothetical protein